MADCDDEFQRARDSFRKASEAADIAVMRGFANAGLRFLDRADALSAIVEVEPRAKRTPGLFQD